MARVNYRCPECGGEVALAGPISANDIKCPECGAWFAPPPRYLEEGGVPYEEEGHSNAGLWIGLAIGGGLLLLLVVCGGIGGFLWYFGMQRAKEQRAAAMMMAPPAFQMPTPQFAAPTEFQPQTEDYAEARKKFKTNLILEQPSPQAGQAIQVPPDVAEIEYTSGELRLKAWVTKDPGGNPAKKPAVLFLHNGFAFGIDDWQMIEPFRDAGYVVMVPMLRGENWQPGSFSLFYNEVDDVLAAADALAKLPYVDEKRIFLAGHSNGGTLTLLTAMTTSRFRAAASFSGSPDQVNWTVARSNMLNYGGDLMAPVPFDEQNRKEFEMRSPLAFPESFKCPVRLYFGNQEPYFKVVNQKLAELAKKKKLDVEAIEVSGNHITSANPGIRQSIEFFKKHEANKK